MLALLLTLSLGQSLALPSPSGPIFSSPERMNRPAFFEAFPTSGAGVDTPETLCAQLAEGEKVGNWTCFSGDGTFASGGATLAKTGNDTDSTGYVCGGARATMASRNPGGASGARWSTSSTRVGGANYTTCAFVVPLNAATEQPLLTWASGSSSTTLGVSPFLGATAAAYSVYYAFGAGCSSATSTTAATALVPGAAHLLCTRISDSATDLDLFINGVKQTVTTTGVNLGCDDGTAQNYSLNSYSGAVTNANASRILGAFATETALSDVRIAAISAAVLGVTHTGAKNEALTFSRTGAGSVTKAAGGGLATTGIADGDVQMCAGGQPRVALDSQGVAGLLVEAASTNYVVRYEAFDDASFFNFGTAPTLNGANAAVSPNGNLTAEDYTFGATTAGQNTGRYTGVGSCSFTTCTSSVYVRGVSGSGTLDVCHTGGVAFCTSCAYTSDSWTRCSATGNTSSSPGLFVGNATGINGGIARAQNRVYVWGGQTEPLGYATSIIPTSGVSATRNAETASFAVTWPATAETISMAISYSGYARQANPWWISAENTASNYVAMFASAVTALGQTSNAGVVARTATGPAVGSLPTAARIAGWQSGTTVTLSIDGTTYSNTAGAASAWTPVTVSIGSSLGYSGYKLGGVVSRACMDPSQTRCR